MRQGYGQFCPVAVASEIFAERWTPIILRELLSSGVRLFGMPAWPVKEVPEGIWDPKVMSDLVFMRLDGEQIRPAGVVSMQDAPSALDCPDESYDWYGNARLFFVGDRVFALSANLFKEARYAGNAVSEVRRVEHP